MIWIQFIAVIFALVALFFSYLHFKKKDFSRLELIVWAVIWIIFGWVALFPSMIRPYVEIMGFARLMDFVVTAAFVVVFIVLLHSYLMIHRLKKQIETLTREIALKGLKKK